MLILEWLCCLIFFLLSLTYFNDNSYDVYTSSYNTSLGVLFLILAIISGIVGLLHAWLESFSDTMSYSPNDNWDNYYDEGGYLNYNRQHEQSFESSCKFYAKTIVFKSSQDIVNDIVNNYPQVNSKISSISCIKTYEKKNTNILDKLFSSKIKKKNNVVSASTTIASGLTTEVLRVLSLAMQEYVYHEYIPIIKKHIMHISINDDTAEIFFKPSCAVQIQSEINRNCIIASMRKNIKDTKIQKFKFTTIDPKKYKLYYEHADTLHS